MKPKDTQEYVRE